MKPIHWILIGLLNLGTLALMYFGPEHPHPHAWDKIPLFYAGFGFVSCILIIVVSKFLGKAFLQRPEDYYDRNS
jgi:hypothetical protein